MSDEEQPATHGGAVQGGASQDSDRAELALITGLSGSGKSTVAKSLEDLGYYCIDNLPLGLLRHFLRHPTEQEVGAQRIAIVTDVRAPGLAPELPGLIRNIDRHEVRPVVVFLDCSDDVLVRRFSETRRRHPLSNGGTVLEGIRRERELLADVRAVADLVLDSSQWTIHDLRAEVYREFGGTERRQAGLNVSLVSFGFKHGIPHGSDLLFDLRFLPNPHFVLELREKTGRDEPVKAYLESKPEFSALLDRLEDLLLYLLPRFRAENRSYLTVSLGCTGGQHRSVAACEKLSERLRKQGWPCHVVHRELDR